MRPQLAIPATVGSRVPKVAAVVANHGKAVAPGARLRPMISALRQPMTADEFLAWEASQDLRHEFDGFAPVAMTGGTFEHDAIQVNLVRALANRLAGTPCRAHGNSTKVEVAGSI